MDESPSLSTLFTTLACAALSPGLRSILIFDAPSTGLQQVASLLEPLLRTVSEQDVKRYQLDAGMREDDTWGSLWVPGQSGEAKPLLFSPTRNAQELQLITIRDLAELNLSAALSCIMLIGAEVAHPERNGEHQQWHPEQCWLAACATEAIGRISPHLLDRFALRLSWKMLMAQQEMDLSARSVWLRAHVPQQTFTPEISLPGTYIPLVQQAALQEPALTAEVLHYIVDILSPEHYTPRRELALARFSPSRSSHGPIVGVAESETLHDLALVSTMQAAAKFQTVRGRGPGEPLRFEPIDLRCYRRGFASDYLLLLLLDYTSVRANASWRDSLLPYLHDAYVRRAEITIVKIGAQDSISPLRAELIHVERGILVPRVGQALISERGKGSPTPLAHGLQLTLEHLRRVLQHGRSTVTHVTLAVVTDGRGNVPLEWSVHNHVTEKIITREGVEDALTIAWQIADMKQVETILLHPLSSQHADLPRLLAQTLNANIIALPSEDESIEVAE